jgi:hypothetical protein
MVAENIAREIFAFAGMLDSAKAGTSVPYRVWSDRHGGLFVLPESSGRPWSGSISEFGPSFPELRRATRHLRLTGESERLGLDANAVHSLTEAIGGAVGESGTETLPGFRVAVPGAYRKITVALTGADRRPLAFAKLAAHDGAVPRIRAEAEALAFLGRLKEIRGQIPRSAGLVEWNGRSMLVMSPGPSGPGVDRFGSSVKVFLERLHLATASIRRFSESDVVRRWTESLSALEGSNIVPGAELIRTAVERIEDTLGDRDVPLVSAHGDFTRWNTCTGPDGLFVFDWETALRQAVPGCDAFHFDSTAGSIWSRGLRPSRKVVDWIDGVWPGARGLSGSLWSSYLVETGLQYGLARTARPADGDDRVYSAVLNALARQLGDSTESDRGPKS